jgi:hypothetical protein
MNLPLESRPLLASEPRTVRKLQLNLDRNRQQDHTEALDAAAAAFDFAACKDAWWNPAEQSLLHGTALWDEASESQRKLLNQLFWVAYYSQIISAEIATIFFNQTSGAALYGLEDFRLVCDTLDLESSQERAHIAAFKKVSEAVEAELFGERVFTWPMRGPYEPTMIFSDLGPFQRRMRSLQLRAFGMLSSGSAFIGCQYFTVRGLRTLNGKMVQQRMSNYHQVSPELQGHSPVPTQISYFHFMDESFHFNSSTIIGLDVIHCLPSPTPFERLVANLAVRGCQQDHSRVSVTVRGLFWDDPAAFDAVYKVLRSTHFGLDHRAAVQMMRRCYGEESEGMHQAHTLHETARASYQRFISPLNYLSRDNMEMKVMAQTSLAGTLARNRVALDSFERRQAA